MMKNSSKAFFCLVFNRNFSISIICLLLAFTACGGGSGGGGGGGHTQHDWEWTTNAIPATCTEASKDTAVCRISTCNETMERTGSNPARGHDAPGAIAATCQAAGNTGTGICSRPGCGQTVTGETIPLNPDAHAWGAYSQTTLPSCTTAGVKTRKCSLCSSPDTETDEVGDAALGHLAPGAILATCQTEGNTGTGTCTRTGCSETVTGQIISIDPDAHNWNDWTANAIAATCTSGSKDTADCKNSGCVVTKERPGSSPALGHLAPAAIAATCQTEGNTGTGICTRCSEPVTGQVLPIEPNAHNWDWTPNAIPATCTEASKDTASCKNSGCTATKGQTGSIAAQGHTGLGTIPATCQIPGNTEAGTCSTCSEYVVKGVEIPIDPDEHDWDWTLNAIAPTCGIAGKDTASCKNTPCTAIDTRYSVGSISTGVHTFDAKDICSVCYSIKMVQISAGTFQMGQTGVAVPVHQVTLRAFKMGKYEVTQELYEAVMGSNPSNFNGGIGLEPDGSEFQGRRPVEGVSWYDAVEFCNKLSEIEGLTPCYTINKTVNSDPNNTCSPTEDPLRWLVTWNSSANGYRLPTEAEWEYTCRAGTTTAYSFGDTIDGDYAWYSSNSVSKTHEVGKKFANPWGLYDMHGNVVEWCWDWYGSYSSGSQYYPTGPSSGHSRVVRGGRWNYDATILRSAYRDYYYPDYRSSRFGFRVVRP